MIIDATDLIMGRMATKVAKQALLGEEVHIINCEKAVFSGTAKTIIAKYQTQFQRGTPAKGPFLPRQPQMFVKRIIRGMIPYKKARGKEALARVKCHKGVPLALQGKEAETIESAKMSKLPVFKTVTVEKVTNVLGAQE
jgi:large subunit ribosomal protein L13